MPIVEHVLKAKAFLEATRGRVVLDVRSPKEYAEGHIPGAVSFPLFTDDERAAVLAYLATYSPNAPAQPEPLPEQSAEAVDISDATETAEAEADVYTDIVNTASEAPADTSEAVTDTIDVALSAVEEAANASDDE